MITKLANFNQRSSKNLLFIVPQPAGHDRAITLFSLDGRLYQVEYAIQTVGRGNLTIGIKNKDGIVLSAEERSQKLQISDSTQMII